MALGSLAHQYDVLLFDLDGTVWEGGRALDNAVSSIIECGVTPFYITNNASRPSALVAEMLGDIGLECSSEEIITSAEAALELARPLLKEDDPILVLGAQSFKDLVSGAGYRVVSSADDAPVAVLQGHCPETGWRELSEAALAIHNGAVYLASNLDTSLPMERGLMVGNGSMVAAVTSATGVVPEAAGKPEPAMFHQAVKLSGATRALAVGDRLDTDIAGGNRAGMDTLQVLTGVSGPYALLAAKPVERPTYIGDDLRSLLADAESLRPGAQGGFVAKLQGDTLLLNGGAESSSPTEALRTALAVAWSAEAEVRAVEPVSQWAQKAVESWW